MTGRALRAAACALVLASAGAAARAQEEAPPAERVLTRLHVVDERPGAAGAARGGIPLARELDVRDPSELAIVRESAGPDGARARERLPVQWRVLSRWGGAADDPSLPVRCVLADVDAPPGAVLGLVRGAPALPEDGRVAYRAERGVVVDDGRLAFDVPADHFAPAAAARARQSEFEPSRPVALSDAGLDAVVVVAGEDGVARTYRASRAGPPELVIEDSGALAATIAVRSALADDDGRLLRDGSVRVALRLHVRRGTGVLDLDVTLHDAGDRPLDVVSLELTGATRFAGGVACAAADGLSGSRVELTQAMLPPAAADGRVRFAWALRVDGVVAARGERSGGVLAVGDGARELSVAIARPWQTAPRAIAVDDGVLRAGLLPRADAPFHVEAGRRVTSTVRLAFGGGAPRSGGRCLVPDAEWIARSGLTGPLPPLGVDVGDEVRNAAARHLERLEEGLIDVTVCDAQGALGSVPPASLTTQRETRGGANPALPYDVDLYGWQRFGDLVDADGPADGDHGWVEGLCRAFLARRDARFLAEARDLARLRVEMTGVRPGVRAVPGLLLLHAITGDAAWLEAAEEMCRGAAGQPGPEAVIAWMALTVHTGAPEARERALRLHERELAEAERPLVPPTPRELVRRLRMHRDVHRATGDARALAALLREARRALDDGYAGTGRVVNGAYLPLQLHGPEGALPLGLPAGLAVSDALAYAYRATGEPLLLERARDLFGDAVLFLEAPPMELVAPGYHAPVGVAPLRHPGREIEYGELLLRGAPWLLDTDAALVRAGAAVTPTTEPLLLATARATLRRAADEPVVGSAPEGPSPAAESDGTAAPEAPVPAPPAAREPVVIDDADAELVGPWETRDAAGAIDGAQSVSVAAEEDVRASFLVPASRGGRVRVYVSWQREREPAARMRVRVAAADGAVTVELDGARGAGRWRLVGEFATRAGESLRVDVERATKDGVLAIDGVRVVPVR